VFNAGLLSGGKKQMSWNPEEYAAWQVGWQGKVKMLYDVMKDDFVGSVAVVSVKGGPASDWERHELETNFSSVYGSHFDVVKFATYDKYFMWLQRQ
jgi:hypothetical protein